MHLARQVVEHISNQVAVMYVGKLVEHADGRCTSIKHLCKHRAAVPGPIRTSNQTSYCRAVADRSATEWLLFPSRCRYCVDRCKTEEPVLRQIAPDHFVSCHRADELKLLGVVGLSQLS
jgi:peptide/nickel transport system ATP-binding protein